jgi:hypothetical protein
MNATSKLVKAWESKNAKNAAKAGGVSLMALSLAACGGSSTTTAVTPVVDTPATDPVETAALTKGVDALKGGSGDDAFSGQAGDTNATIIAGDSISGGAGTDTFTLATNGAATTVAGLTLTDVENVRISDSATTSATVNLFGSTGITDIESYASTGAALSVINIGAIADLNLTNTSGTGTVTLSYAARRRKRNRRHSRHCSKWCKSDWLGHSCKSGNCKCCKCDNRVDSQSCRSRCYKNDCRRRRSNNY